MRSLSRLRQLAAALYGGMAMLALAWAAARNLWPNWWQMDGLGDLASAIMAGVLLGLLGVALSWQLERWVPGIRQLADRFSSILGGLSRRDAVFLAAVSAIGEELLFRGCLQEEIGLWPATLAFACVHVGPERIYLWWTASAFVYGLGLALLYELQGGLLAPILMHFVINSINIAVLGHRGGQRPSEPTSR